MEAYKAALAQETARVAGWGAGPFQLDETIARRARRCSSASRVSPAASPSR